MDLAHASVAEYEAHVKKFEPDGPYGFFTGHQRTNLIGPAPRVAYLLAGLDLVGRHGKATVTPDDLKECDAYTLAANIIVMLDVLTGRTA